MSAKDFKTLLKVLSKMGGYPNDDFYNIIKYIGYVSTNLLTDMINAIGEDGAYEFIGKSLKLLSDGDKGIRIDLKPYFGTDSWAYLKIKNYRIDLEQTESCILVYADWGNNKIIYEDGNETTFDEMYEDVGLGDLGDWSDFMSNLQDEANAQIERKTGLCLWWD